MDCSLILMALSLCVVWQRYEASRVHSGYFGSCEKRSGGTPRKYSEVPCNIDEQYYCTVPGDDYPRNAVRSFVNDNQGLMRRMYGDLRHLTALRSEMEWNSLHETQQQHERIQRPSSTISKVDDDTDPDDLSTTTSTTKIPRNDTVILTSGNISFPEPMPTTSRLSKPAENNSSNSTEVKKDKGINACPTKQEVVAPYWALNTRGRTVAIVNDPPYEQYIHWEKCTNENQQMLCRDGCKCEQQYRLQRLLAFDPTCDCKGVFMDWFLLPSCCVCKCYGMSYNDTVVVSSSNEQNTTSGSSRRRQGRAEKTTSHPNDTTWIKWLKNESNAKSAVKLGDDNNNNNNNNNN